MLPNERNRSEADPYVADVLREVRWKQAHETIARDLADHIEDQAESFAKAGMPPADAAARAVAEMGDPAQVGLLLDASYRPRVAWRTLLPLLALVLMGVLLRAFVFDLGTSGWPRFLLAASLGCAGFYLLLRLNLYKAVRHAWRLGLAFLVLAILLPRLFLYADARRWLALDLQYLWLLFPVLYALMVYRLRGTGFGGVLAAAGAFAIPFLLSLRFFYDSGVCVPLGACGCFAVLLTAIWRGQFGCNRLLATGFVLLGSAFAVYLYCFIEPYRLSHIWTLLDPSRDAQGRGWWVLRIREIVAASRLLGRGGALPPEAEAIVAGLGAEPLGLSFPLTEVMYRYGIAAALLPVVGMLVFLSLGIRRTAALSSTLGKLMASGILAVFACQALLSPLTCLGVPLFYGAFFPFLSADDLALFGNLLLAGLLASLLQKDTLFRERAATKKRLRLRVELAQEEKPR